MTGERSRNEGRKRGIRNIFEYKVGSASKLDRNEKRTLTCLIFWLSLSLSRNVAKPTSQTGVVTSWKVKKASNGVMKR